MNLGFKKTAGFWRENTESITICRNQNIINEAKEKYLRMFNSSEKIIDKIAEKNAVIAGKLLKNTFNINSSSDAKKYLAKTALEEEIKKEKKVYDIIKEAIRLKEERHLSRITKDLIVEAENNLS